MLKLEYLAAFAAIAETGSMTGAAARLSISKSVVSERLLELERTLGSRLVERTTRRLALTEDGHRGSTRAPEGFCAMSRGPRRNWHSDVESLQVRCGSRPR